MSNLPQIPEKWLDGNGQEITPTAALMVVKGENSVGEESHIVIYTDGLNPVDALGMTRFAEITTEDEVRKSVVNAS